MKVSEVARTDRWVRRGESAWQEIMSRFAASGQTREVFCREEGLALSTFDRWRQRLRRKAVKKSGSEPPLFVELSGASTPMSVSPSWDVELELGSGLVLRLKRSVC